MSATLSSFLTDLVPRFVLLLQNGFLTMDQARSLLPLTADDPNVRWGVGAQLSMHATLGGSESCYLILCHFWVILG